MEDSGIQIFLFLTTVLCTYAYLWLRRQWSYWDERGVPNKRPTFRSKVFNFFFPRGSSFWRQMKQYEDMAPHRYAGLYFSLSPGLLIRDPELIKAVFVKQGEDFSHKTQSFYSKTDKLTHFLVNMSGERWKWARIHLSPAFTAEKLKPMLQLMTKVSTTLSNSVAESLAKNNVIDVKFHAYQYYMDLMAACVFGVDAKTIGNEDSIFLEMTRSIFGRNQLSLRYNNFLLLIPPEYRHYFSKTIVDKTSTNFFRQRLLDSMEFNEKNNTKRPTFVTHFTNIMKSSAANDSADTDETHKWTIDSSLSHCLLFTYEGLIDPSSLVSLALYEIAKNTDVQNKLREEIQQFLDRYNNDISYEVLREMEYLNKVVLETLRKYPPSLNIDRTCTRTCQLADTGLTVEKGVIMSVPIGAIHHDPKFYPNPRNFDPDRFNQGWKVFRHPYSYLPFGCGPRNCLAERFVILGMKAIIVSLLSKFEVSVLPENLLPFEADIEKFTYKPTNVNVKFVKKHD